ncbi:hypothetical protein L1987_44083 [Smallanthus sonchifolius]|uniref:Uncharacterized protein n=1 Tax=Smallanthus sonchifolius TaxID=185202 RepID=A0ACB9GPF3_9ASTR|nr:hypothetical protein L1987_44083 [Smallanthus sonchifolius]
MYGRVMEETDRRRQRKMKEKEILEAYLEGYYDKQEEDESSQKEKAHLERAKIQKEKGKSSERFSTRVSMQVNENIDTSGNQGSVQDEENEDVEEEFEDEDFILLEDKDVVIIQD